MKRFALAVFLFPLLSLAQTVLPPLDPGAAGFDPLPLVQAIAAGAQSGNWGPVVIAALVLSVWLVRFLARKFPSFKPLAWVSSSWGGWALNLGGSLLAAIGTLVFAGGPLSVAAVVSAVIAAAVTGFASAGVVELKKDLLAGAKSEGAAAGLTVASKKDALEELK